MHHLTYRTITNTLNRKIQLLMFDNIYIYKERTKLFFISTFNTDMVKDKDNVVFICFDPNNDIDDVRKRINQINANTIFYKELKSCISFIQSIQSQKAFLVMSSSQIISDFINLQQVHSIFMFCSNIEQHNFVYHGNPKVIGVYDNMDSLCSSIQEQINYIQKRNSPWCFFNQYELRNRDLSKYSSDFIWLHLFHDVLPHLSHDQSKEALHSFISDSSLQKEINTALQTRNVDHLYRLRYFLGDLVANLACEHRQIIQSNREKLIVYRQMKLSNDELKQLQQSKGQLMSMKGFLIAHTHRPASSIEHSDMISVLFQIECNVSELGKNLIFVDLSQLAECSTQNTILFDFNTTFRLENIEHDGHMWTVKLKAVNDGQSILKKYIDDTHRQIENLSIPIIFGKLLCDMGEWNKSQQYFERLMNNSSDEDMAWIEHSIGEAHKWKGEWTEARQYYDRAYNRMMEHDPIRLKDSALILSDIGEVLHLQGKYKESLDYHERALTLGKEYYSSNHSQIATSLSNIGFIHLNRRKWDEAALFFQQALSVQEEYYNCIHFDIARTLKNIAILKSNQRKYDEAIDHRQRALSIYEKYYPSNQVLIASTLSYIGYSLPFKKEYHEALDMVQRALIIQKRFYPFGHIDITKSLSNIAIIKTKQLKYDESLELYQQVLIMQKQYYLSDHLEIVRTLNNIGLSLLNGKENYDEALHYQEQALQMLEVSYPSYYGNIATNLHLHW